MLTAAVVTPLWARISGKTGISSERLSVMLWETTPLWMPLSPVNMDVNEGWVGMSLA
ncbi:hypothetical protein ES703_68764 [subsurface metagenome]